jgi:hypothetical protein
MRQCARVIGFQRQHLFEFAPGLGPVTQAKLARASI